MTDRALAAPTWDPDRLLQILQAPTNRRRDLAPALIDAVGATRLDAAVTRLSRRIGQFDDIDTTHGRPVVRGPHGHAPVWVHVNTNGEFDGLLLGPASTRRRSQNPGPGPGWRQRGPILAWCSSFLLSALWVWTASSVPNWCGAIAVMAAFLVLLGGLDIPSQALFPRWLHLIMRCITGGAAASAVRLPHLPAGGWGAGNLTGGGCLLAVTIMVVANRRNLPQPVYIHLPIRDGRWYVTVGGGRLANHHRSVPHQHGALDLVALQPSGARAHGLWPRSLTAYAAYNKTVVSPCQGIVAAVVDGAPDQPVGAPIFGPPYGNHVRIRTPEFDLILAHLRPGSIRVTPGQLLEAGDRVGRVGNSGNSTEPHLHIHAEHDGRGLGLRFTGIPGRPLRGRKLSAP